MASYSVALTSLPQKFDKIKKLLLEGTEVIVTHRWMNEFRLVLYDQNLQEKILNIKNSVPKLALDENGWERNDSETDARLAEVYKNLQQEPENKS